MKLGHRPKYPFGLKGPFQGMTLTDNDGKVVYRYVPNPKQHFAHNCMADELLFGGAVAGGKSYFVVHHNKEHCTLYGRHANTVLFRRTFDELEGSLIADQKLLFDKPGIGVYRDAKHIFEWANGARTWFRHLEDDDALLKHQSRQYTLIGFDELTHFTEKQYLYLFQRLRSPRDPNIFPQMISATNPRGPGHKWVMNRFITGKEPFTLYSYTAPVHRVGGQEYGGHEYRRVFVPSRIYDNEALLENDPGYLDRLKLSQSDDLYRAYVEGDWNFFEGMAFPEWDEAMHVVDPFPVPKHWKVIRCMDWGYTSPFHVGWLAQDPETRAIYLVDEWYGAKHGPSGGLSGVQMAAPEVREGIKNHEVANVIGGNYSAPWYGVADPTMWSRQSGETTNGDLMNQGGALFKAGNRDRLVGKQALHALLRRNPETGKPGFFSFKTCGAFNQAMGLLMCSENGKEDVEKCDYDHPYDSVRYGVMELVQAPAQRQDRMDREALRRLSRMPCPI